MVKIRKIVPDEWLSTWACYRDMWGVATSTGHGRGKIVWGNLIVAVPMGVAGYYLPMISEGVTSSILSTVGVLAGFVFATFVFSGVLADVRAVPLPELKSYGLHVRYLLFCQVVTLLSYLTTIIAAIAHQVGGNNWTSAIVYATTSWSIFRTLLLPGQAYNLQQYSVDAMIRAKEKEVAENLAQKKREIQKAMEEETAC